MVVLLRLRARRRGGVGVQLVLDNDPPKSRRRDLLLRLLGGAAGGPVLGGNGGVFAHLFRLAVFIQLGICLALESPCQANCLLMKVESSSSISDNVSSSHEVTS